MSADIGSAKSRQCSPQNNPRRKQTRAPVYVLSFLLALSLVYIFHGQVGRTLPRIQGVEYEDANGDIVYGLRIFAPGTQTEGGAPRDWLIEVGKIPDDSLRDRQLSSYVGLADSWLYFRLTSGEETHFLLASLWLANLIRREEAAAILRRGPSRQGSDASPTIHRLPSLATLTAAYWAGTQVMLFEPMGCLNKARPAILGAITVVTTAVLFSKSSRDRSQHEDVPHEALTTAGFAHGPDAFRIGGSHWVKVTRTLSVEQLQDSVAWLPSAANDFVATSGPGTGLEGDDWLVKAASKLRGEQVF